MNKDARLALRLSTALMKRLKAYARRRDMSVSSLVVKALEELIAADDRAHGSTETVDAEQV